MTLIREPGVTVSLQDSVPSGPPGETRVVQAPAPLPPSRWSPLDLDTSEDMLSIGNDGGDIFVAVGEDGRATRSIDTGLSWSSLTQGLGNSNPSASIRGVDGSPSGVFIAVGINGACRSDDFGETWAEINPTNWTGTSLLLSVKTNKDGHWLISGSSSDTYYSTDDGISWTLQSGKPSSTNDSIRSVTHVQGLSYLICSVDGLAWITLDGGISFDRFDPRGLNTGDTLRDFYSIAAIDTVFCVQANGPQNAISYNSGTTWVAAPLWWNSGGIGVQQFGCLESDGGNTFISVQENGYAARGIDRGTTWIAIEQGLNSGLIGADFNGLSTNKKGIWIAVANGGYGSRGTI